jgi:hypothetical protein
MVTMAVGGCPGAWGRGGGQGRWGTQPAWGACGSARQLRCMPNCRAGGGVGAWGLTAGAVSPPAGMSSGKKASQVAVGKED